MTVASASNPSGSVRVRATEAGRLVGLRIDQSELRFGAEALAASILTICADAAAAAAHRHRAALLGDGVPPDVVDRVTPATDAPATASGRWTVRP